MKQVKVYFLAASVVKEKYKVVEHGYTLISHKCSNTHKGGTGKKYSSKTF